MTNPTRLTGGAIALAVLLAPAILSAGTADAAVGGGCSPVTSIGHGTANVCIGAAAHAIAGVDDYVNFSAGHVPCTIRMRGEKQSGGTSPWFSRTCPASGHVHIPGGDFSAPNGLWRNHTDVIYTDGLTATKYSPWLQMP